MSKKTKQKSEAGAKLMTGIFTSIKLNCICTVLISDKDVKAALNRKKATFRSGDIRIKEVQIKLREKI